MKVKRGFKAMALMLALALVISLVGVVAAPTAVTAQPPAYDCSQNIALVPDSWGWYWNGGQLPTSGFPATLADGVTPFTPSFTNLNPFSIMTDPTDPIAAGGFDTVVLVNIESNTSQFLSDPTFMSRLENFVHNGGKLIIYTSETQTTSGWNDYFFRPFVSNNPGAYGASGTPIDISENNTLSHQDPASYFYVDVQTMTNGTDAVGDANVFVTYDPNWCEDMWCQNVFQVVGPVHCYSHYYYGLIIYNGLDIDYMDGVYGGPAAETQLEKIWMLELMQPWNPTGLPCGVVIAGQLTLDPVTDSNPINTIHEVTATLVDDQGTPVQGVTITFTVTGVNPTSGTADTDINGEAEWSYTGTNTGQDKIVATCDDPANPGMTLTSNDAFKDWTPGGFPPVVPGMTEWGIIAAIAILAPTMVLVLRRKQALS